MGSPQGPVTTDAKIPPSLLLKLAYDDVGDSISLVGYSVMDRFPGQSLNAAGVIIQHDPFTGNVGVAYEDPVDGSNLVNLAFAHLDTLSFVYADDVYSIDRVTTAGAALRDCRDSLFNSGLTGFSYLEPAAYITGHEIDVENRKVKVRYRLYSRFERDLKIRVRFALNPPPGSGAPPVGWTPATGAPTTGLRADSSAPEYVFEHDIDQDLPLEGPARLQYEIWPYEVPVFRQPCIDLLVDLFVQGRITGCNIDDDGIKVNGVGYATVPIDPGTCAECNRLGGTTPGTVHVASMPLSEALQSVLELCHNQASEIPDYFWGVLNANEDDSSVNAWGTFQEGGVFNAGFVHDFDLFFEDAIRFDPATMGGGTLIDNDYDWTSNALGVGVQLNTNPKPTNKQRSVIFELLTEAPPVSIPLASQLLVDGNMNASNFDAWVRDGTGWVKNTPSGFGRPGELSGRAAGGPDGRDGGFFYQDVSLAPWAAQIGAGNVTLSLDGYIGSNAETTPDQGKFQIEVRDGSSVLIHSYDSGWKFASGAWVHVVDSFVLPAAAATVRFICRSDRRSGSNTNTWFDEVVVALDVVAPAPSGSGGIRVGAGVAAGGAITNTMRVWQGIHLLTVADPVNGDVVGVYEKSAADLVTPATLVPGSDTAFSSGFKRGDLVYFLIDLHNGTYQVVNLMTGEAFAGALPGITILWEWMASDIVAGFGTNAHTRLMQALPDGGITAMLDEDLHSRPLTISAWLQPFERDDEGIWPTGGHLPYPPNAFSDPLGVGFGINVWSNNGGGSALAVAGVGNNLLYHGDVDWVPGQEYFIAVVYDETETRVYADGTLLATGPAFQGLNVGWYQMSIGRHRRHDWPWGFGPMRWVRVTAGPRYGAELPILDEINLADAGMTPIPTLPMTGPSAPGEQVVTGDQPDAWELYDDVGGTTSQLDEGEEVVLDQGPGVARNPQTIEVVPGATPTALPLNITVAGSFTGNAWLPIPPIDTPTVPTLLPALPTGILGSRNVFQGRVRDARIARKAYRPLDILLLQADGPAVTPTQAGLPPECLPSTLLDGALMWLQPAGQPEVLCEAWAEPGEIVTFGDCTPDGKTVLGSSSCLPYVPFEILTFGGIAISTRKFKGYTGPCCTIRKVSDPGGPTFDVGWDSEGWRDDDALEAWADGEATECVRVYSQAPDAEDLVIDANPACDGPFRVTDENGSAYKTPDTGRPMFWAGVSSIQYPILPSVQYWMISENNLADNDDKMICAVVTPYRPVEPGHGAASGWSGELCGMSSGVFAHEILFTAYNGGFNHAIEVEYHGAADIATIRSPSQWGVEQTLAVGYAAPVLGGGPYNLYKNGSAMPLLVQGNGGQWWDDRKMRVGAGQFTSVDATWHGGICEFVCVNGTYPDSRARDIARNQGLAFGAIT